MSRRPAPPTQRVHAIIRDLVRETLLREAATGAAALLARDPEVELVIGYNATAGGRLTVSLETVDPDTGEGETLGTVHAGRPKESLRAYGGPCRPRSAAGAPMPPAWEVRWSQASKGLGPLLYDAAMEAVAGLGGTLTSDRDEVSDSAQRVWSFYARNRSDVVAGILDDELGTLTPDDPDDDCSQFMSKSIAADGGDPGRWHEEPTSRAYTTAGGATPTLDAFRAAGRLRTIGLPGGSSPGRARRR